MFTSKTPASDDARCGHEFSQRLFPGVSEHKTLGCPVATTGLNCRIERASTVKCLHCLTPVRNSSFERLLTRHSRQQAACQSQWPITGVFGVAPPGCKRRAVRIGSPCQSADKGFVGDSTCSWHGFEQENLEHPFNGKTTFSFAGGRLRRARSHLLATYAPLQFCTYVCFLRRRLRNLPNLPS